MSLSVLLIDDDKSFCQVMSRHLQHHGFNVDVSFDSLSALEQQPVHYDVILLDMMIGSDNGIELIQPLIKRYTPDQLIVLNA